MADDELKSKYPSYLDRLVATGFLTKEQIHRMFYEINKNNKFIVQYLVEAFDIKPLVIAETISAEYEEPLFNLGTFNLSTIPKDVVDEKLVTKHKILPLAVKDHVLFVALTDPTLTQDLDTIRFNSKKKLELVIVEHDKLERALEEVYGTNAQLEFINGLNSDDSENTDDILNQFDFDINADHDKDDTIVVKYLNKLLYDAIKMGASDLHFEPYAKIYRVRYRIDGVLHAVSFPPLALAPRLTVRLKIMAKMDISERRSPQDGRIKLPISQFKSIDFRASSLPTLYGEKLVLRILDSSSATLGINALGYEEDQKALFIEALDKPQGMLLITGPTGSGKTVSLYTGLNILNREDTNISTAEDPVEINLEGINQVNVNNKVGLTFAAALKSFLRQDPDIIMVGEIRDLETAEIAIKAAQTGHMVMSTLHTNSAPETLTRLRNMGVPSFNLATSVNLVIAQRLARRLCSQCKKVIEIPKQSLLELGFTEDDLANPKFQVYQPVGCAECREGYKGRVGIYEVMKVTPEISKIIMEDGNSLQIAEASNQAGFNNLRRSGLIKVMQGVTSLQEVNRVTSE
ncbi:type IV-A pilus assembly ATPase PilB [Acinetobacter sp. YH16055]|uniref:type IV-A pilus assembly ATPase PilB n=1 Tax=Acinetobacter sp. YH16055 TaxID=2601193 RepID=UPI0015D0ED8C|nr:type IV-A pilus assembly ATPase PilB [Acinetobacter sp. YH16055]